MLPKSKIRLSRSLHAQTTPYPNASKWLRRGIFLAIVFLGFGIYFLAKPEKPAEESPQPKQILGEDTEKPEYTTYTVKKGDTLFNLSQNYGVSWQTLAKINDLKEPFTLKIGQKIKIPASE